MATTRKLYLPHYQSGNWYLPPSAVTLNAGSAQGSTLARGSPLVLEDTMTVSALGVRVTTNAVGNVQLALYNADQATMHPTSLIDNTASLSTSVATVATGNLSQSRLLTPGAYWLFAQLDATASGNSVVLQSVSSNVAAMAQLIGDPTATNVSAGSGAALQAAITNTFGTWSDFSASAYALATSSSISPAVLFKAA